MGEGTISLILSTFSSSHPVYQRHNVGHDQSVGDDDSGMDLGTAIGVQALGTWGWSWGWEEGERTKVRVAVHNSDYLQQEHSSAPHCVVRAQIINNDNESVRSTKILTSSAPRWDEVLVLTSEENEGSRNPARSTDSVSSNLNNRVGAALLLQVVAVDPDFKEHASAEVRGFLSPSSSC